MKIFDTKINFNPAGSGSITKRLTVPSEIIKDMNITAEENKVQVIYDEENKTFSVKKC